MEVLSAVPPARVMTGQLYSGQRTPVGTLVAVSGDFRQIATTGLIAELGARVATGEKVILDLTQAHVVGSAFLGLAGLLAKLGSNASQVKVVTSSQDTIHRLRLMGLMNVDGFEVFPTVDEARTAL